MIFLSQISKSYADQTLFENASVSFSQNERVGIIGRNGHGKSTLLKIISGDMPADDGQITIHPGVTLGFLNQHMAFTAKTVREEALLGFKPEDRHQTWVAAKMLWGLGFNETDQNLPPQQFSGGFQMRIQLCKVLLGRPDVLLLDEPTNFLDIVSLRWLETFLNRWKGTFLLVTHDMTFLSKVTNYTLAVHRQRWRKIKGSVKDLRAQLALEEQVHEKTRKNEEKKEVKEKEFIKNFRAGARSAGLVQSRIKMLAKKTRLKKLPPIPEVKFNFIGKEFQGDKLLQLNSLCFAWDDTPEDQIIHKLDLTVYPDDRIAIIGPNGRGKTTLLRLIAGELAPKTGTIKRNESLELGYFGQMNKTLKNPEKTVFEALNEESALLPEQEVHKLCGSLMFERGKRHKQLKVLSGGERSRVNLGKLMLKDYHLLLLDEPTNHLDVESCEALENAFESYNGAIICVTHDEKLIRNFANRLIVFDAGEISVFNGDYETFLAQKGWQHEHKTDAFLAKIDNKDEKAPKEDYKKRKEREKKLRPLKKEAKNIETTIEQTEQDLKELETDMKVAKRRGNYLQMDEISRAMAFLTEKNEEMLKKLGQIWKDMEKLEKNKFSI